MICMSMESICTLNFMKIVFVLSTYPVVERLIEQFSAIEKLFLDVIFKNYPKVKRQPRVIRISEALTNIFTLPTLHFILFVLESFQKYEKLFQRQDPTIHLLYDKQVDLFRGTLLHFCVFSKIKPLRKSVTLIKFDYKHNDNVKPLDEISIGVAAKGIISKFSQQDKTVFLSGVKRFFIKLCDQLLAKLSLKSVLLGNLRFLNPENINEEGQKMISYCASNMPPGFKMSTRDIDALSIEWQLLRLEDLPDLYEIDEGNKKKYIPLDKYWRQILNLKESGELKYPIIERVVKFALSIAEANASVERLFSQLLHIISKDRNKLEVHTIKGLLITKSFLHSNGTCMNLDIDDSMMYHLKASHSKYVERNLEKNQYKRKNTIEKSLVDEVHRKFTKNKKLKAIENKRIQLEKQENLVKANEIKAMSLLKEAQLLMKDTQDMNKQIVKEKKQLQETKSKLEEAVLHSTCQTAAKKIRMSSSKQVAVDLNNNVSDASD